MKARELMTAHPFVLTPADPVSKAAEIMRYEDIGAVPIVEQATNRLLGIITDRDIAIRCVARRHGSGCTVGTHMTPQPLHTVFADADGSEIVGTMESADCRRVPVIDGQGRLIGIVAERDLAMKLDASEALPARRRIKGASPRARATVDVLVDSPPGETRW